MLSDVECDASIVSFSFPRTLLWETGSTRNGLDKAPILVPLKKNPPLPWDVWQCCQPEEVALHNMLLTSRCC